MIIDWIESRLEGLEQKLVQETGISSQLVTANITCSGYATGGVKWLGARAELEASPAYTRSSMNKYIPRFQEQLYIKVYTRIITLI